jgi:tetraacyldisaccharide 4'-kinase
MKKWLLNCWYTRQSSRWLLFPLSLVYQSIAVSRRYYLQRFRQQIFSVPIIVVGNISVGGAGKTPLVIALAEKLKARGLRVGIVSRGYGATVTTFPYEVKPHDLAAHVGDEPLLLAKRTGCPVVIAPDRVQAVRYLLGTHQSQVVISDDGLQHYKMGRAVEIAVIDGVRGLGNGLCLPAGPLRERASRLSEVDFIVVNGGTWPNGYRMDLQPGRFTSLTHGETLDVTQLIGPVAAVAGIGHPKRFFNTLDALGLQFKAYAFPDHYSFQPVDLSVPESSVVMTEKDAVKCQPFAHDSMYYLPVEAVVADAFWQALWAHKKLKGYV